MVEEDVLFHLELETGQEEEEEEEVRKIRAVQSLKCIIRCAVDCTNNNV
jgi:hypothetical protein